MHFLSTIKWFWCLWWLYRLNLEVQFIVNASIFIILIFFIFFNCIFILLFSVFFCMLMHCSAFCTIISNYHFNWIRKKKEKYYVKERTHKSYMVCNAFSKNCPRFPWTLFLMDFVRIFFIIFSHSSKLMTHFLLLLLLINITFF